LLVGIITAWIKLKIEIRRNLAAKCHGQEVSDAKGPYLVAKNLL